MISTLVFNMHRTYLYIPFKGGCQLVIFFQGTSFRSWYCWCILVLRLNFIYALVLRINVIFLTWIAARVSPQICCRSINHNAKFYKFCASFSFITSRGHALHLSRISFSLSLSLHQSSLYFEGFASVVGDALFLPRGGGGLCGGRREGGPDCFHCQRHSPSGSADNGKGRVRKDWEVWRMHGWTELERLSRWCSKFIPCLCTLHATSILGTDVQYSKCSIGDDNVMGHYLGG